MNTVKFDVARGAETFDQAARLLDFMLPRRSGDDMLSDCGFELLERALEFNPLAEAVMMSAGRDDAGSAVEALTERGAFYLYFFRQGAI